MNLRPGLRRATVKVDGRTIRAVVDLYRVVDLRDQRLSDEGRFWAEDGPLFIETTASAVIEMDDGTSVNVRIIGLEQGSIAEVPYVKAEFIDARQLRES